MKKYITTKYIRTKGNTIYKVNKENNDYFFDFIGKPHRKNNIKKVGYKIEDLFEIGDIIFYWSGSDDKEHAMLIVHDFDISTALSQAVTRLYVKTGDDYKLMAKAIHEFITIDEKDANVRFLKNKNELENLY